MARTLSKSEGPSGHTHQRTSLSAIICTAYRGEHGERRWGRAPIWLQAAPAPESIRVFLSCPESRAGRESSLLSEKRSRWTCRTGRLHGRCAAAGGPPSLKPTSQHEPRTLPGVVSQRSLDLRNSGVDGWI